MNPLRQLTLDQLRQRTSMKWRYYPEDVLPVWVAEMDVHLAEPVAKAITDAVARGDTGYPAGTAYAEALAEFAKKRWDWAPAVERTAIVPDVMLGVVEMFRLVSHRDAPVVVNCPVYPPFYQFIESLGRTVVEAPLDETFRIDFDILENAFARAGKGAVYLLCNPHNPTGTVHTEAELAQVAQLARRHGVRVVADEIHAPLTTAKFVPYLSVADDGLSLMSASKAWNLAGLKAALAIAGPDAADDLAKLPEEVSHGPSHVGILAHTAAFNHAGDWLDALLEALDENRRLLQDLLAEELPSVRYRPAPGTYLAWLDCRELGLGDRPAKTFLDRGRVAVNCGTTFGTGGNGFVRMNLATSPEIITEAVRRMAASR
ncbi:cystathionine beta-lyase [Lentzea aerocolonigenes]|uniref:cysteine-S-conjugate beta-lyase n=1 Tax=Lentzea aerocolonigenes TaxID=68170 RepID=A0A0F0H6U1_LENAE|nr:aminotransferase class I/II-fold pyridoxal phosphate-dependent enzyme [Lentzea aerocolonigenes]KJK49343.1 cystathionine beta-lyase [Lentzea aerocolonigenes]